MTPTELLKPRYEVIADYPGNNRPVGFVFTMDKKDSEGWYTTTGYLQEKFFIMYPNLFRPLAWWEHRKPEEMPEYVKYEAVVRKVDRFDAEETSAYNIWLDGGFAPYAVKDFLPATEAEYQEYLKSKV